MARKLTISKARSALYSSARLLGDMGALASGSPRRIMKRLVNKAIGRKIGKLFRW